MLVGALEGSSLPLTQVPGFELRTFSVSTGLLKMTPPVPSWASFLFPSLLTSHPFSPPFLFFPPFPPIPLPPASLFANIGGPSMCQVFYLFLLSPGFLTGGKEEGDKGGDLVSSLCLQDLVQQARGHSVRDSKLQCLRCLRWEDPAHCGWHRSLDGWLLDCVKWRGG